MVSEVAPEALEPGSFSIDRRGAVRILRVLSGQKRWPRNTKRLGGSRIQAVAREGAPGRSSRRGVDMKRKKGDDEEFDVFGDEDVEAIGDDELEDDEEFDEDDLDDDEFSDDDDDFDDDFVEDDDLQVNEDDLEEFGNDSER
jgi:hypothetical protein